MYQANICRVLRAPMDPASDIVAPARPARRRATRLRTPGVLRLPEHGVHIASASPELYLRRAGERVDSRPIKGTGVRAADLLAKDEAENVMIVDLVRNDLGRVCRTGSVTVPGLLEVEAHPGLVHLVSTVAGDLRPGTTWPQILEATFPPGSVTGAPKLAALDIIRAQERGPARALLRGLRMGRCRRRHRRARRRDPHLLARGVGAGPTLAFGTGAGITWDSDPRAEWRETQLKAARLLAVAGDREVP